MPSYAVEISFPAMGYDVEAEDEDAAIQLAIDLADQDVFERATYEVRRVEPLVREEPGE